MPQVRHGPRAPHEAAMSAPSSVNESSPGLIARIIAASASRPFLTILFVAALTAWGWVSLQRAPLDAIPDLSDVQVIVFTECMGHSPDLPAPHTTYPISRALTS